MNDYSKSLCAFLLKMQDEQEEKEIIKFILEKDAKAEFFPKSNNQKPFDNAGPKTVWRYKKEIKVNNNILVEFDITHETLKNEKFHIPWEETIYDKLIKVDEGKSYFFYNNMKILFFDFNHKMANSVLKRSLKKDKYFQKMKVNFPNLFKIKEIEDFIGEIEGFWSGLNKDNIRTIAGFGGDVSDSTLLKENVDKLKALYFDYISKKGKLFERILLSNNGVLAVREQLTIEDLITLYLELIERGLFLIN
ncbi:hypothetical protein [Marinitoga sp. 1155]|uniref:hypothetical protein n=1 Tax=Marinitoga sp. 1155 TaxID=1428448 RepID=UPI0006414188|nr:hypothetical protein [Marinitoga sp. 1155]KLO24769.1 hypothetical protein X274_02085 [Marinitoga sp. 1155]